MKNLAIILAACAAIVFTAVLVTTRFVLVPTTYDGIAYKLDRWTGDVTAIQGWKSINVTPQKP